VAFHFADTRAYRIPVPTGQWFPELNLRFYFYVRKEEKRATVFLREFVPSPLIALGARLLYHQPYYLALIDHQIRQREKICGQRAAAREDSWSVMPVQRVSRYPLKEWRLNNFPKARG
jgi:uncharacterized protein YqjF (DUF2071 family)